MTEKDVQLPPLHVVFYDGIRKSGIGSIVNAVFFYTSFTPASFSPKIIGE